MIDNDDNEFIEKINKLPNKEIRIDKYQQCEFFLLCSFKDGCKAGKYDGYICNTEQLKECYLKNVKDFKRGII